MNSEQVQPSTSVTSQNIERKVYTMKLTNPEAIRALKKANILQLSEMVSDYPESDVDGRSDWEIIANEAGWLLDMFNSGDTAHSDDLRDAREFIRNYQKGIVLKWYCYRIEDARATVNEYNRLVRFVAKLKAMGLYCPYC